MSDWAWLDEHPTGCASWIEIHVGVSARIPCELPSAHDGDHGGAGIYWRDAE